MTGALAEAPPLHLYGSALRAAACGERAGMDLVGESGAALGRIDPGQWLRRYRPADTTLLQRCHAATLDVGCGPGRLVAALARAGHTTLGIDVSAEAVRLARLRGAPALRRDVFGRVPARGTWHSILLADGNVGIGGDPVVLLRRCAELLAPTGEVLVELSPPGQPSWAGAVRLRYEQQQSAAFAWAVVSVDDIADLAGAAVLAVAEVWTEARRWFARLRLS